MLAANIENLFVALNVKIEIMSSNEEEVEKSCCVNWFGCFTAVSIDSDVLKNLAVSIDLDVLEQILWSTDVQSKQVLHNQDKH